MKDLRGKIYDRATEIIEMQVGTGIIGIDAPAESYFGGALPVFNFEFMLLR